MSFFAELKRRNVFKIGMAYAIVAWLLIQVADVLFPTFNAPEWVMKVFTVVILLGFPIALIITWAFELTSEGIKPTNSISPEQSIASHTGHKLNYTIIALLSLTVILFIIDKFTGTNEEPPALSTAAVADKSENESAVTRVPDDKSIAVLPFANRSTSDDDTFFVDGIHDDILTQLSKISALKVISRTSVMQYKETQKTMKTIGEELGVGTILEGGVQRAGQQVRINVQLIDADTDKHLWAESFDRELTAANIFTIQSEIATAIAEALRATLTVEEQQRIAAVPTENLDAYNFYLSGVEYFNRREDDLAIEQFQRAVKEDPEFAHAWAYLSRTYSQSYWFSGQTQEEKRTRAQEAVERALAINPGLPEAHFALGHFYYHGLRKYEDGLKELDIAEQGMPGNTNVLAYKAFIHRRLGQWQEARDITGKIVELNPRAAVDLADLAIVYMVLGEYEETERLLDRALEIRPDLELAYIRKADIPLMRDGDWSSYKHILESALVDIEDVEEEYWQAAIYARDYDLALSYLEGWQPKANSLVISEIRKGILYGATYFLSGDTAKAREKMEAIAPQVEKFVANTPGNPFPVMIHGFVMIGLGEMDKAVELGQRAKELLPVSEDAIAGKELQIDVIRYIFLSAGAYDLAIDELDDYLSSPAEWRIEGLLPHPAFDPVRDNPRFLALVEKYKRD